MPIEKNKLAAVMELLCRADADNASGNTEKINELFYDSNHKEVA